MNENLLKRIKNQLNAKFYVMNDTWLKDCIEFFIRDKALHEITDKHIFEFVEGQWQLSNLREINNENGCLPRNLAQQLRMVLTGTYILQVDKMYDITSSKYKQLCNIRKVNNDNLEITKKEESTEWEPRTRRTMQLCLTDGIQDVTAIEYVPLKHMTGTLLPGYKVMIIGPVNCRRGVILLENGKYKEIGGEVESLLKPNALENVLAKALGEPENPDPYHDNRPPDNQNMLVNSTNEDCFFDDDFEQAVDLEAVTAIERQSQEVIEIAQNNLISTRNQEQIDTNRMQETMEELLEDIDFEPLETRSSDLPRKTIPTSRMKIETFEEKDNIMIIEEASTSRNFQNRLPLLSANSMKNKNTVEFPDDNFDFNDYEIIQVEKSSSHQQDRNFIKSGSKIETRSSSTTIKTGLTNDKSSMKVEYISAIQNKRSVASTSCIIPRVPNTKTPSDVHLLPSSPPKICDTLSDVLRENFVGTIYRTVRGQVKSYSALTKQGKCWAVTALIADHTSSTEVGFDSEILEEFLGFTVQEFLQKKKLAKADPQINNELRLSLRKAQHQIETIDGLLKLELIEGQAPKVVGITQVAS